MLLQSLGAYPPIDRSDQGSSLNKLPVSTAVSMPYMNQAKHSRSQLGLVQTSAGRCQLHCTTYERRFTQGRTCGAGGDNESGACCRPRLAQSRLGLPIRERR